MKNNKIELNLARKNKAIKQILCIKMFRAFNHNFNTCSFFSIGTLSVIWM